jgi:hypothetical protein
MEIRMLLLVKTASSVKSTRMLKKGSSLHCQRNHWQNSLQGENNMDLELVFFANSMGGAIFHEEPTTLSCLPHVWQLFFVNIGKGVLLYERMNV